MKNRIKGFICFVILFTLFACSRSLFINKNAYSLYKMPVIEIVNEKNNLKTDGYYLELESHKNRKNAKIFYTNGYVASFVVDNNELESNLKNEQNSHIKMAWYILKKDSIIIEGFGENPNEIDTYSYKYYGNIKGDSLNLSYENSNVIEYYKFIQDTSLTKFTNDSRYIGKKWYNKNLHYSRK